MRENTPAVSVIMPVYNSEKYLFKTINSLLKQSFSNWELIVIDDGSTDSSKVIIDNIIDHRIFYFYQENKGVMHLADTLNFGLSKSRGEFVTMLPSDDLWPIDRLESQISLFEDKSVVLCFGRQMLIDENDNIIGKTRTPKEKNSLVNYPYGSALHEMFQWNFIPQPTVLIRTKALKSIGGYLQPFGLYAEDYPTHMQLSLQGRFCYQDKVLAYYRQHPNQMTRTHYAKMAKTDADYVLYFYDNLPLDIVKITGWTRSKLEVAMQKRIANSNFIVGRQLLINKKWISASRSFFNALLHGDIFAKFKSILGLLCICLRIDFEILIKLKRFIKIKN